MGIMAAGTVMEVMEVTVGVTMVATEVTTMARGPLMLRPRLRLMLSPPPLLSPDIMVTDTDTTLTDTDTLLLTPTDIIMATARGLLMLSPDMGTTAMGDTSEDTVEDTMVMVATEDTTMARGLLRPSPDMAIMAIRMDTTLTDTEATEATTTVEKFQKFMLITSDFRVQYK